MSLRSRVRRLPGYDELIRVMSGTDGNMAFAEDMAADVVDREGDPVRLLDLGCGSGDSADYFETLPGAVNWHGVDVEDSPEVDRRERVDKRIKCFDGISLPYDDNYFDVVYSRQVFEHVRHPHDLMADVFRVLKPGGQLVGSVAYLEPYHSLSTFNFTPFGMIYAMRHAGLQPELLRHSSDVFFAVLRQLANKARIMDVFRKFSVMYFFIELVGRATRLDRAQINLMKIQYSSSFCFLARKPE